MALTKTLLLVDDEIDFAKGLARLITAGFPEFTVLTAHSGDEALELLETHAVAVMLLDLNMPGMHGMDALTAARALSPATSVIVLTAHGTLETAVMAVKRGAWDFLTKPIRREDLVRAVAKALEHNALREENQRLKQVMAKSSLTRSLTGDSPSMRSLRESIAAVAPSSYTVLVRGESGTGKELVAEAIHSLSGRQGNPLVKVNCPAIPEALLESELFGHAKGAFTGASGAHRGMFVQAAGGTLFLDEVGDVPLSVQTKLLRALQDGEVRPVGSNRAMRFDTRIIAATNQNLEAKIQRGTFREDLFYRLNVLTIHAPALRERREDIPMLAAHFLSRSCAEMGIPCKTLSPSAMGFLAGMDWPGNARELQNFIRRLAVFSTVPVLDLHDVKALQTPGMAYSPEEDGREKDVRPYKNAKTELVDTFTRTYVISLLTRTNGNISEAARLSGLERVSLQKMLRRLGVAGTDFRNKSSRM